MKFRSIKSAILITLSVLGIILSFLGPVSNSPIIPNVHATPPNNFAVVGLFSESKKSNVIVDSTILSGGTFQMDVNVTDAGSINGFDINVTFASASLGLATSPSVYSGSGCPASDRIIAGSPSVGATLKSDPKIKYVDSLGYGYWAPDSRDSIIYDSNANGVYNTGEPVIFGITPANLALVKTDSAIKYVDLNNNNVWDAGEPVVLDPNNNNVYDTIAGCIFDRIQSSTLANVTSNANWYRLSVLDKDQIFPFVNGNGILFRLTLKTKAASVFSTIHIATKTSVIENPSSVPYNPIHGYFDSRATPANFGISETPTTVTIVRPVLSSQTSTGTTAVSISTPTGGAGTVTLTALSLPNNVDQSYSTGNTCSAACTPTLTLTVHGGPKANGLTTPSGTYFIPIIGNTTSSGSRVTWLKVIVQPPAAPVFTFSVTPTSYSQEAGNWTALSVSTTLSSGANDSIALGQNCPNRLQGGLCSFKPSNSLTWSSTQPFTSVMNVSTNAVSTVPGVYKFNATATSQGTYSEIVTTQTITLTMTVIKTHDLAVQGVILTSRNFAYNGVPLSCPSSCPASPAGGAALKTDPKIKYIDLNNNNVWDPGEPVVYDTNSNGLFDSGESVIAGSTVLVGQALKTDTKIKFVDGNGNNVWDVGEFVVYDSNNDNLYQVTEPAIGGPGQLKVNVTVANLGTVSETFLANSTARVVLSNNDCRLNFVDANNNQIYDLGETVVIDSDCNGRYGSGTLDSRMRFVDANNNGHWDPGETVVIDADSSGTFDLTAPLVDKAIANSPSFGQTILLDASIKFVDSNSNGHWDPGETVVYDTNNNGIYDAGEPVIAGTTPTVGQILSLDTQIKFADLNNNGHWDTGEPVAYDANNNGVYDPDFVISGTTPANGTVVKFDPKLAYVDSDINNVWDTGETVFYDTNGNGVYDSGETIIVGTAPAPEPVLVGTPPAIGALLSNQRLSYTDTKFTAVWDPGEFVVYDANSNNIYDAGETPIAGLIPSTTGQALKTDPKVMYADLNNNGVWDLGEPVVYNVNVCTTCTYAANDPIIHGPAPTIGQALKSDPKIKYVDANSNGVLDLSESLVWDSGTQTGTQNGLYDAGELIPVGQPLSGGILLGSQTITVVAGATMVLTLGVDTGSLPRGKYLIGGAAAPITSGCPGSPCEFNTGNNSQLILSFTQKFKGDVNGDCKVDITDLALVGGTFGKVLGQAGYNAAADLNNDGVINIVDLVLVAGNFGQSC